MESGQAVLNIEFFRSIVLFILQANREVEIALKHILERILFNGSENLLFFFREGCVKISYRDYFFIKSQNIQLRTGQDKTEKNEKLQKSIY